MVFMISPNGSHFGKKFQADIICLQETHLTQKQEYIFKLFTQSYDFWFSHGTSASAGVLIAICHSAGINIVKAVEMTGQLLALDLCLSNGDTMRLLFLYA